MPPESNLWKCPHQPCGFVRVRLCVLYLCALHFICFVWISLKAPEGGLSVLIAFLAAICPEAASHIYCTAFFSPRSLSNFCRKRRWIRVLVRLRKRSVGPKRQERSRGRERRLCDVTGKAIKGQSVGRGSGRKGGGEQERLQWISWILCICYLITWKALKVTDYHNGKLFPSQVDPDI